MLLPHIFFFLFTTFLAARAASYVINFTVVRTGQAECFRATFNWPPHLAALHAKFQITETTGVARSSLPILRVKLFFFPL